jgi:hypothetical protein
MQSGNEKADYASTWFGGVALMIGAQMEKDFFNRPLGEIA